MITQHLQHSAYFLIKEISAWARPKRNRAWTLKQLYAWIMSLNLKKILNYKKMNLVHTATLTQKSN